MKIQVISEYAYPDNFRVNEIIETLTGMGHGVRLITGLPDYANGYVPAEYKRFKNRKEYALGAEIIHIPSIERRTGVVRRILNYMSFMVNSSLYALFSSKRDFDVIFVNETSPIFQLLPGIIWKKKTGKKLVLYCYDLWPESMKAWNVTENNLMYRITKKFCVWLYSKCDVIAITSRPFSEYLVNECRVPDEKIYYLPQFATDEFADIAASYEENNCIDFLFAGNVGAVQNLDVILDAVSLVKEEGYLVHIVGDGSELVRLMQKAKDLQLEDKIVFHGRFPASEMKRFYAMADCFLATLRGGDFIGKTLPAKVQSYLSVGKPIIGAIEGAGADTIRDACCGEAVNPNDAEGLAEIIRHVITDFEKYKQSGKNARTFYEKNYTKEIFMANLLNLLGE